MRGKVLVALGRVQEALDAFANSESSRAMVISEPIAFRCFTLAENDRMPEAKALLQRLVQASPPASPLHLALAHLGLGDLESAQANIDLAFAEHDVRIVFLAVERRWQRLGEQPFAKLLTRAGFRAHQVNRSQPGDLDT